MRLLFGQILPLRGIDHTGHISQIDHLKKMATIKFQFEDKSFEWRLDELLLPIHTLTGTSFMNNHFR